jgi:hypothetical protein
VAHAAGLTLYSVPYFYPSHPSLWSLFERYGTDVPFTLTLAGTGVALLWLCWTRDWRQITPGESIQPSIHAPTLRSAAQQNEA